jgi:hypothetical protein
MSDKDLANLLNGFEALSIALERFITEHETDQLSGEVMFALVRAKDANDRAADLIRKRVRG